VDSSERREASVARILRKLGRAVRRWAQDGGAVGIGTSDDPPSTSGLVRALLHFGPSSWCSSGALSAVGPGFRYHV
jgi:hypothetical protein